MTYRMIPVHDIDQSWLEALRRAVYQELYVATWGGWDEARHKSQFARCWGEGDISIVELDGDRVGMIQLHDRGDRLELAELHVAPSRQNQGIGTRVLRDLLARAGAEGKTVGLSVGLSNRRAAGLYERLGFRHVAQTQTHLRMEWRAVTEAR